MSEQEKGPGGMSRRDFLKLMGAAGTSVAFAPFVPWGKFMPNPSSVTLAKVPVILPDGESLDDVTFHSFNVTGIDDGVYDLKIMAVDLAENEQTKMISFNVDHAFVQEPSIIPEEKDPSTGNNLLIMISSIIVAIILISIIVKRIRKTSRENKILKEDL